MWGEAGGVAGAVGVAGRGRAGHERGGGGEPRGDQRVQKVMERGREGPCQRRQGPEPQGFLGRRG